MCIRDRIDNLLEVVDLTDKKDTYVDSLSRGMKQRLCLARSLIHDPDLIILDEPASGLDPRARVEMKEILKELREMGKTIIVSSHILPELAEMCSEIGIIDHGKLVTQGTVNEIMNRINKKRLVKVKPVSYTHLDVYKRQAWYSERECQLQRHIKRNRDLICLDQ